MKRQNLFEKFLEFSINRAESEKDLLHIYNTFIKPHRLRLYNMHLYLLLFGVLGWAAYWSNTTFPASVFASTWLLVIMMVVNSLIVISFGIGVILIYTSARERTERISSLLWTKQFHISTGSREVTAPETTHLPEAYDFAIFETAPFHDDDLEWSFTGNYNGSRTFRYYAFQHEYSVLDDASEKGRKLGHRYGIVIDRIRLPSLRNTVLCYNVDYPVYMLPVTFDDAVFDQTFKCYTNSPNVVRYIDLKIRGALMDMYESFPTKDIQVIIEVNDEGEIAISINSYLVLTNGNVNVVTDTEDRVYLALEESTNPKVLNKLCSYAAALMCEVSEEKPVHLRSVK